MELEKQRNDLIKSLAGQWDIKYGSSSSVEQIEITEGGNVKMLNSTGKHISARLLSEPGGLGFEIEFDRNMKRKYKVSSAPDDKMIVTKTYRTLNSMTVLNGVGVKH